MAKKKAAKKKKNKVQELYGKIPSGVKVGILSAASMAAGAYGGPAAASGASMLLKLLGGYLGG